MRQTPMLSPLNAKSRLKLAKVPLVVTMHSKLECTSLESFASDRAFPQVVSSGGRRSGEVRRETSQLVLYVAAALSLRG